MIFFSFMKLILQMKGSVFPRSCFTALPCAVAAFILKLCMINDMLPFLTEEIFKETGIWGGFSFLVAFLVVFRTSQSYARFWEGCTSMHKMGMQWFNACSLVISFCKISKADEKTTTAFKHTIMRLFSMLHAVALAEIEDKDSNNIDDVEAFKYEVFDVNNFGSAQLLAIRHSVAKVELVYQWLQQLLVLNMETKVLNVPPPLLTRAFQELANGMVEYHEARKISRIPFPFPYAQTCDWLLLLHMLLTPFVVPQWVNGLVWVPIFTFIQVFIFWSLRNIAVEVENPFGADDNDCDAPAAQAEMNRNLEMMLSKEIDSTPPCVSITLSEHCGSTLSTVWHNLDLESDSDDSNNDKVKISGSLGHKKKKMKKKKTSMLGNASAHQQHTVGKIDHIPSDATSQIEGPDPSIQDHRCIKIQIASNETPQYSKTNSGKEGLNHHNGRHDNMINLLQAICSRGTPRNF